MGVAIQTAYSPAGLSNEWACHEQAHGTNRSSPLGLFPFSGPKPWLGWVKRDCRYRMYNSHVHVHLTRGTRGGMQPRQTPRPPFRPSTNTPISLLRFTEGGLSTLVSANVRALLPLFFSMAKWKLKWLLRRITRRSGFSLWTLLSTKLVPALLFSMGAVYRGELRIATVHLTLLNT